MGSGQSAAHALLLVPLAPRQQKGERIVPHVRDAVRPILAELSTARNVWQDVWNLSNGPRNEKDIVVIICAYDSFYLTINPDRRTPFG